MSHPASTVIECSQVTFDREPLPDNWRWVRLEEVCSFGSGRFLSRSDIKEGGSVPVYGANGIIGYTNTACFSEPQIVIGRVGSCGAINVTTGSAWITDKTIICTPKDVVNFDYLANFLRSVNFDSLRAAAIQPLITQSTLRKIRFPLPPVSIQQRIASVLNKKMAAVGRARAAAEAQLEAANDLPAAFTREVFDGREARHWEVKQLGSILEGNGQYGTSERATATEIDGLPVLGMVNLYEGQIRWEKLSFIKLSEKDEQKYRLEKGDVLFNRTNSVELVGKTAVFDGLRDAVFASYLIRLRVKKDIADPNFVSSFINSGHGRRFIEANMTRAIGQANVSASVLSKMPIPVPRLTEQQSIASTLIKQTTTVEQLRSVIKNQLDTIKTIPAALLRQAFTGRL